ncbi:hypothetical protein M8J75_014648 [Diaphorina citri]|nr:hypothetical protein M8J75_014648 [Diaphorina citri]
MKGKRMAPNSTSTALPAALGEPSDQPISSLYDKKVTKVHDQPIIWSNTFFITLFHCIAAYAPFYCWPKISYATILWGFFIGGVGGFGVTGGVHRLWSHRSYKARWPLRLILLLCYSVAGQNSVFNWVRDHRVHHKYSETDADPHNSKRGFFFAHVGWLMCRKHKDVIEKGRMVDMSDVMADPLVRFHEKHFFWFKLVLCFIIPTIVPYYYFGESLLVSVLTMNFFRYILTLNFTWAAAELGNYSFNITTFFIDFFAKIGWAYDRKQPSATLVRNTALRHGDGSHCEVPPEADKADCNQNCAAVTNLNLTPNLPPTEKLKIK